MAERLNRAHLAAGWLGLSERLQKSGQIGSLFVALFAMSDALASLNPQASVLNGSFPMLPPRLLFWAPHYETIFLRTLVTPRIVAGHHPATAVATRDTRSGSCVTNPWSSRRAMSSRAGHALAPARSQACEKTIMLLADAPIFEAGAPDHGLRNDVVYSSYCRTVDKYLRSVDRLGAASGYQHDLTAGMTPREIRILALLYLDLARASRRRITATPPASLARRSCSFSLS